MLPCRNVTLRSNITVSVRDTRSPNTTVSERDTQSIYLIILVHQAFFMSRRHLNREDLRFKIQQPHHSNPSKLHNHNIEPHNQAYRRHYNITQYISITIKSSLWTSINHNLPPPKNRDRASYFSMPLLSSSFLTFLTRLSLSLLFLFFLLQILFVHQAFFYIKTSSLIEWI